MDSFALMWFGLQRGTAQSDTLSQCTELLSLSFSPCVQFMCFQTGQSTPLSCDGLSLPLPPTISALSMSVKKPPAISLSHTYTLLSLVANSQCHTAAIFFIFSSPLHFVVSFLHFFLYKPPCIFISLFFCLVSVYFVDSLLILSSANLYPSPFPSQQSQLLVISLPLGFIKLKPSTPSQPPASIKM